MNREARAQLESGWTINKKNYWWTNQQNWTPKEILDELD